VASRSLVEAGIQKSGTARERSSKTWTTAAAVAVIILAFAVHLALISHANTITWDEPDHIYSGYRQWQGDFGLNPEHPPLVKFVATLPLLGMHLQEPPMQDRRYRLQAVLGGRDFVFHNGDADKIVFRAQMAASVFTLLLLLIAFLAAQEMFGTMAGFIVVGLLAFDPTMLAHGAVVTTDMAQACVLLASVYGFYRYVKQPSARRMLVTGLAVGLALASKHSAVLIGPMLVVLAVVEVIRSRSDGNAGGRTIRYIGAVVIVGVIGVVLLWAAYGFRFAARPEGLKLNPPMTEQLTTVPNKAEAGVLAEFDRVHLLPESYIYGMAHVLMSAKQFNSYIFGKAYPNAVWFYFPLAMLVKSSLTFLVLLGIAIWAIVRGRVGKGRELWFLLVPPATYLGMSMQGGMNIGIRHILPVYVFLAVVIAGAAATLVQRDRRWAYAIVALLLFQAVSVTRAFPDYIGYSNEVFGGPKNAWRYISDSSADWAQQLHAVKRYTDEHQIHNCWFVYFGTGAIDYDYYGIPCKLLPTIESMWLGPEMDVPPAIDGPVLVSADDLTGFEFGPPPLNPYEQFKSLKPTAVIDSSVFVYDGHFEIPLAAALARTQKAIDFLIQGNATEALEQAQQALALAPDSATTNATMGSVLDALGRRDEARLYDEKALQIALGMHPGFQKYLVPSLERRLAEK